MTTCYACGAHVTERATRGPLMTQLDPPGAYWRGKRIELSPRQLAILHLLCARGEATYLAVEMVGAGEDAEPGTATTVMSQLRKRLPPGPRIEFIKGWGYRLITEDDQMTELKEMLRIETEAVPDDAKAALLISVCADNTIKTSGATVPLMLQIIGALVSAIGANAKNPPTTR